MMLLCPDPRAVPPDARAAGRRLILRARNLAQLTLNVIQCGTTRNRRKETRRRRHRRCWCDHRNGSRRLRKRRGRRLLKNTKYGPGNRPYWEMKEGRAQSRYPDLIRALAKEKDPVRRRQLFESHRLKIESTGGASRTRIEQRRPEKCSQ